MTPAVHDVLPRSQIDVPLLEVMIGGIVGLNHLVQGHGQLLPAILGLPTQLLDGRMNVDSVLGCCVHINHLPCQSLFQSVDPLL